MPVKRILVVDDDSNSRRFFELCLEGWGFDSVVVNNGEDALAVLDEDEEGFDLIITDVMMPFTTGFELTQTLKESPATANIPVLAVSAFYDWNQARKEGELPVDGFMTKPVSKEKLRQEIDRLLSKGAK